MELSDPIRRHLEDFSRNVLFDRSRTDPISKDSATHSPHEKGVLSSLPLQMSLYFNMWFFPFWWVSETAMLHLKFPVLPDYYKVILVILHLMMIIIEIIRLYLGYTGNLQEKVPELAGFWLLTLLLQCPMILFQLFNEEIVILPLEKAVHIILCLFIFNQVIIAFLTLRNMVRHTESQFRLRHFE